MEGANQQPQSGGGQPQQQPQHGGGGGGRQTQMQQQQQQQGGQGGQTAPSPVGGPQSAGSAQTPGASGGLLPALSPEMNSRPLHGMQPGPGRMHHAGPAPHGGAGPHGPPPPGAGPPGSGRSRTHTPRNSQHNVFQAVMGAWPGQVPQEDVGGPGNVKVYASAYSQIPVFEAMIRNISVMRRMADSWVNATQILKVAGISKSVRTKILEKQVQTQMHEKVQGGYGKYQGTWIPLDRGRILAEQYGVLQYLAPIFDFVPPPTGPPALPMRGNTPNKTPGAGGPPMMHGSGGGSGGRMISPFTHAHTGNVPPPPQFMQQHMPGGPDMMGQPPMLYPPHGGMQPGHGPGPMFFHPQQHPHHGPPPPHHHQQHPPQGHQGHPGQQHPHQPPPGMHQQMGYDQGPPPPQQQQQQQQQHQHQQQQAQQHAQQQQQQARLEGPIDMPPQQQQQQQQPQLQPPATINGHGSHGSMQGLPPPPSNDVYVDSYGQPRPIGGGAQPTFVGTQQQDEGEPPAKRARTDAAAAPGTTGTAEQSVADEEDDDDDEMREKPPLPSSFRLSSKPFKPRLSTQSHRRRQQLLSLFQSDDVDVRAVFELSAGQEPDWDIDMVIDELGHTALHWACSLARMPLIKQLIELGADIHRGNYAGETPLIRSVLTANNAEAGTFGDLLANHLGASVRTLDHAYCSVIHHIAFASGLKGRGAVARGYMAEVLGYVAREQTKERTLNGAGAAGAAGTPGASATTPAGESASGVAATATDGDGVKGESAAASASGAHASQGTGTPPAEGISLKRLVDLQDVRGDTALNVAARMGSKPLVNLLIDAGADKVKANKLGLRPVDFGIEVESLTVAPKEAAVAQLKSEVKRPEKRSADVLKNISGLFEDMNRTFDTEMEKHVEAMSAVERNVRTATRSLADRRQQVDTARARLAALEQQAERAANAKRALNASDADWTLRTPLKGETSLPAAFGMLAPLMPSIGGDGDSSDKDAKPPTDPALPPKGDANALTTLRRIAAWEDRAARLLEERAAELEGDGADRAIKYRKVIALCAKVSVDQVDDMLDGLTTAVESDGRALDLSRIAGVVHRLRKAPVVA